MLRRLRARVRAVLLRRRLEREMKEEMAEHLRRSGERFVARGLSPEEARRAALREFGNVAWLEEKAREARGTVWMGDLAADLRFALRHLARRPWTVAAMLVVLVVGLSVSTLLFSFVHAYAVQGPPAVTLEDDLVRIRGKQGAGRYGWGVRPFSLEELEAYRGLTDHFAAVDGWTDARVALSVGDDPERSGLEARATFVTEGYFQTLGVSPVLGPGLPRDPSADPSAIAAAVISFATWDRLWGRDPGVVGSTVSVNGVRVTVAGVAPESFTGVGGFVPLRLWLPLQAWEIVMPGPPGGPGAGGRLLPPGPSGGFRAVGRLLPGVGPRSASAAVEVVARRIALTGDEEPGTEPSSEVVPLLSANGDPMFERDVRRMSLAFGLLGLLVLAVTCTNVSALLTGLATARRHEIAVRLSLGAGRPRLIRQLLTESALLAVVAGLGALGLAGLALRTFTRSVPALPLELRLTGPAVAFTLGVALAVGVGFGLSPALHATRLALSGALQQGVATLHATRARLQRGLVVAQIAFTQPLVVLLAAVLLVTLAEFRPGWRPPMTDRLVTVTARPPWIPSADTAAIAASRARLRSVSERLIRRLEGTAGVVAAVPDIEGSDDLGSWRPLGGGDRPAGAPVSVVPLEGRRISEGWIEAAGMRLLAGRSFGAGDAPADAAGGDVPAVIGVELGRRLWPGSDPVGRRLESAEEGNGARTMVVVGVLDDAEAPRRRAEDPYPVLLPRDIRSSPRALLVRTEGPAAPHLSAIRGAVRDETQGLVVQIRTLAEIQEEGQRLFRVATGTLSLAGILALLLSALGLYAVVAFAVGQRRREIAVRMAMGARRSTIARSFVTDGLRMGALGLALGLPASLVGLRLLLLEPDLPRVPLPPVAALVAVGVLAVTVVATWIPARRAAAVDPAVTLRRD